MSSSASTKLFNFNVNSTMRGHVFKLIKHPFHLDNKNFFFTNRVVNMWNQLPSDIVFNLSLGEFKHRASNFVNLHFDNPGV